MKPERKQEKKPQKKLEKNMLLTEFLKQEVGWLILITMILAGFAGLRTYSASYISKIVELLQNGEPVSRLMVTAVAGCLIASASYFMRYISSVLCTILTEKLALQTRCRLNEHLQKIPWIRYEKLETGQLQSVLRNDVQQGADFIYTIFSRIQLNVLLFLATFLYMLSISPGLAVFVTIFTLFMAWVNQKILTKQKQYQKQALRAAGDVSETILSVCQSMGTIKAYAAGEFVMDLLKEGKERFNEKIYKMEKIDAGRLTAYNLTNNLTLYGAILFFGYKGIQGTVNLGDVLVFIVLVRQMMIPAEVVFRWMSRAISSLASWERVCEILEIPEEEQETESLPLPEETVCAESMHFSYTGDKKILDGQSLKLQAGKITVLSGESGCGKTTLCKVLCGLYPARHLEYTNDDRIENDRIRMEKAGRKELYENCLEWKIDGKRYGTGSSSAWSVYSPAEAQLFHMSIYENLVFDRMDISRETCMNLADELGIGDWIRSLPEGLDTMVESGGRTFSGGQRQSIVNMRALLSGKKVLILDEAFASLDVEKCQKLMDALKRRQEERIILLISHQEWVATQCGERVYLKRA